MFQQFGSGDAAIFFDGNLTNADIKISGVNVR